MSDVLPLNGESGALFPTRSHQSDSLLRPVDWIKPSVDRHSSFERRLLFENFTIAGFKDLEAELERQFRVAPTDTVCYQLATTLAQCMPTARSLRRADQLLMRATRPGCDLSEDQQHSAPDVHRSVRAMLAESAASRGGRLKQANWGITVGYSLTPEMAKALSGRVSYLGLPIDGGREDVIADFRKGKVICREHSTRN